MPIKLHYSGKIIEYSKPPKKINIDNIYTNKEKSFIYTPKQELKITDSIFYALTKPTNHIYFITLTYQWKPNINYGLNFRKKANNDLNRFLKFCRDKKNIVKYVGVLELTKKKVPHYHIILDIDISVTGYKRITANKKNYLAGLWFPPLKNYTLFTNKKSSKNFQQREKYFFESLQTHWNTITKNFYRNSLDYKRIKKTELRKANGCFVIAKYLTKYFTKELKKPKEFRLNFGVKNYFISRSLRVKPIIIKEKEILFNDFIFIQEKAQKKNDIYWNKCRKNKNFTENINYFKSTISYYVNPFDLPNLNTLISRITADKKEKTLYDRIKRVKKELNETI